MSGAHLSPVTVAQAEALWLRGAPWRIRLTFDGPNSANKSGQSHKAWEAVSKGPLAAEARFGFGPASKRITNWTPIAAEVAFRRAREKVAKGYVACGGNDQDQTPAAFDARVVAKSMADQDRAPSPRDWAEMSDEEFRRVLRG